ncbi:Multicopper oxidase [hydrothermal vent metagenome]|uniref:Multicopper oxidase n=1 Tax=hydrothermal vent metagenome TaxID=652676 RepID=A0A3B0U8Z4_9ZZZZ
MNRIITKTAMAATLAIGAITAPAFAQTNIVVPNDMTMSAPANEQMGGQGGMGNMGGQGGMGNMGGQGGMGNMGGQGEMGNQNNMMQMMMQMHKMMQQNMGAQGGMGNMGGQGNMGAGNDSAQNMMGADAANPQNMMGMNSPDQVKTFIETLTEEQRNLLLKLLQENTAQ